MRYAILALSLLQAFAAPDSTPKSADDAWLVHEKPSQDSPSQRVVIKDWKIESGDWYRITDQDTKKTYWVHKKELEEKKIFMQSTTEHSSNEHTTQVSESIQFDNKSMLNEKMWSDFEANYQEMVKVEKENMKKVKALSTKIKGQKPCAASHAHRTKFSILRNRFALATSQVAKSFKSKI